MSDGLQISGEVNSEQDMHDFANICQGLMRVLRDNDAPIASSVTALMITMCEIAYNVGIPKDVLMDRLSQIFDVQTNPALQDLQ